MQQQIQQTTEHYIANLPDGKEFYCVNDFKNDGFPSFLIHRIQLALFQELSQSVSVPQTKWANMHDEKAVESWNQFFNSLKNTVRVPVDQTKPLVEQSVTDIIHILVQPRKNIPELLFEEEDTLSADQLDERIKWLVVYSHFGQVLTRYMQRRNKDELNRQQCESIIAQVDEKITRDFTPFQWGKMLQPLFDLTNSPVEADLFHSFFEDRQLDGVAKKFTDLDSGLTQDEFIDVLIKKQELASNVIEVQDEEMDESESPSTEQQHKPTNDGLAFSKHEDENNEPEAPPIGIQSNNDKQPVSEELTFNSDDKRNEESNQESSDINLNREKKEFEASTEELNGFDIHATEEQLNEQEEKPASLNDFFSNDSGLEAEAQTVEGEASQEQTNIFSEQENDSDELPIWQRFADTKSSEENDHPEGISDVQGASVERDDLRKYLQSQENYFVRSLFDGSTQSYLKTLESINEQESWKEAYQLVDREVFKPNKINIYSQTAVDFTDKLQNYFLKVKS